MRQMPWNDDDPRAMTNLDQRAFVEAAKTWGKFAGNLNSSDPGTIKTWYWECCIAVMRTYEAERSKPHLPGVGQPLGKPGNVG